MTDNLVSVANDTKWRELREAMLALPGGERPMFRCKNLETGGLGAWDGEWFYHWAQAGWHWMEWVDLKVQTSQQRESVRTALRRIRFAGEETEDGFRLYGYVQAGQQADWIA